ncbi:transmembrane-type terpene cyclase [Algoriphagus ratkowskyi]
MDYKFNMTISSLFIAICGIGWIIAYLEALRVGFRDNSYGIPFLTLALNFTWEAYYTYQGYLVFGSHVSTYVNCIWVLIDIGILYTYFRYGHQEVKASKPLFYAQAGVFLLACFILQHLVFQKVGIVNGALYGGYFINFLMSFLFVRMYFRRSDLRGQSLLIAIPKCIGTFSTTILFGIIGSKTAGGVHEPILYIGLIIFVTDLVYITLVARKRHLIKTGVME